MSRAAFLRNPLALAGRWMPAGGITATALGTGSPSANNLRATPMMGPLKGTIITKIAVCQQSVTAGNMRMGLYRSINRAEPYPGARIVDGGAQACNAAQVYEWTVSAHVEAGEVVWLVHLHDAAPTMYIWNGGQMAQFGWPSPPSTLNHGCVLTSALAYGALPASFPAGASVGTGTWLAMFWQGA